MISYTCELVTEYHLSGKFGNAGHADILYPVPRRGCPYVDVGWSWSATEVKDSE